MNIEEIKDIEDIKKIKDNLKKSPMFNLSLSSKELFHSNFIHWLASSYEDLFWYVIEQICGCNKDSWSNVQGEFEYRRECENFDFSVWKTNGKEKELILVIENKVKSLPDEEQLKRYNEKIKKIKETEDDTTIKILLSLVEPNFKSDKIYWKHVSYQDYIDSLEKASNTTFKNIPPKTKDYIYHRELIKDYIDFVKKLNFLKNYWIKEDRKEDSPKLIKYMKELRIDDLRQKIICSTIERKLKEKLMKEDGTGDYFVLNSTKSKDLKELEKKKEKEEEKKKKNENRIIERIKDFDDKQKPVIFTNTGYGRSGAFVELKFIVKKEYIPTVFADKHPYKNGTAFVVQLQNGILNLGIELLGGTKLDKSIDNDKNMDFSPFVKETIGEDGNFYSDFFTKENKTEKISKNERKYYTNYNSFEDTFFYRNKKLKDLEELKDYSLNSIVDLFISYIPKEKNKELLCTVDDLLEMSK